MLTFNPGPTHLHEGTLKRLEEILHSGYLSASHRSQEFMDMSRAAVEGLCQKMRIPEEYWVFYQPSATVAMDTAIRNTVFKKSFHFVHGAFSRRFYQTSAELGLEAQSFESDWKKAVPWQEAQIDDDTELITVTHNETSTGLMWPMEELAALREAHPKQLIAVDMTSSFGALATDWWMGDIWFFSVQKCLGLPSGLGIILVSPHAYDKALEVLEKKGGVAAWQSFKVMEEKMEKYQTPETPNMLAIALLAWIMKDWDLEAIEAETRAKAELIYSDDLPWKPYVEDPKWRSITVANLLVDNPQSWHERAAEQGITLGKGYGILKNICLRIANFPGIQRSSLDELLHLCHGNRLV